MSIYMAERTGFEPAIALPQYTLSKRAPSTTRPPLHAVTVQILYQLYNLPFIPVAFDHL